jgi:hypothetical protein
MGLTTYLQSPHTTSGQLYSFKIKTIRWSGHGNNKKFTQIFAGKPNRKRPLGRPTGKCKKNIQLGIKKIG